MLFDYLVFALSHKNKSYNLSIDLLQFYSAGAGKFAATVYKDMPALTFKVNGRLHKGTIIIALNCADYYEVYLQSGKEMALINGKVCFAELSDVIDEYIERGTDEAKYNQTAIIQID